MPRTKMKKVEKRYISLKLYQPAPACKGGCKSDIMYVIYARVCVCVRACVRMRIFVYVYEENIV